MMTYRKRLLCGQREGCFCERGRACNGNENKQEQLDLALEELCLALQGGSPARGNAVLVDLLGMVVGGCVGGGIFWSIFRVLRLLVFGLAAVIVLVGVVRRLCGRDPDHDVLVVFVQIGDRPRRHDVRKEYDGAEGKRRGQREVARKEELEAVADNKDDDEGHDERPFPGRLVVGNAPPGRDEKELRQEHRHFAVFKWKRHG